MAKGKKASTKLKNLKSKTTSKAAKVKGGALLLSNPIAGQTLYPTLSSPLTRFGGGLIASDQCKETGDSGIGGCPG